MGQSLQEILYYFPISHIEFLTKIGQEPIIFDQVHRQIPDTWAGNSAILVLHDEESLRFLYDLDTSLQLAQVPQLVGIIICVEFAITLEQEIMELFQECGIPIIQIHDKEAYRKFAHRQKHYAYSHLAIELNGFIEKGFIQIATELSRAFSIPILYFDNQFLLLWCVGKNEEIRSARRLVNIQKRKITETTILGEFEIHQLECINRESYWLVTPAILPHWQKKLIDKLVGLTSFNLQMESEAESLFENVKRHFVYELLHHKFESKQLMVEQGKIWGWNLDKPHHLFIIDLDFSKGWTKTGTMLDELMKELDEIVESTMENIHTFSFNEQIIILYEDHSGASKNDVIQLVANLINSLTDKWKKGIISVGIGKWYADTTYLNKSYQEAKLALHFGQNNQSDQAIYHYNDMGVIRLLMHIHQGILTDYSEEYLNILAKSDRMHGTEYIKILQSMVQHRWKIDEAAKASHVHSNTIRNHLKKIEKMLEVDLQDMEDLMDISTAIKIHSFFGI